MTHVSCTSEDAAPPRLYGAQRPNAHRFSEAAAATGTCERGLTGYDGTAMDCLSWARSGTQYATFFQSRCSLSVIQQFLLVCYLFICSPFLFCTIALRCIEATIGQVCITCTHISPYESSYISYGVQDHANFRHSLRAL